MTCEIVNPMGLPHPISIYPSIHPSINISIYQPIYLLYFNGSVYTCAPSRAHTQTHAHTYIPHTHTRTYIHMRTRAVHRLVYLAQEKLTHVCIHRYILYVPTLTHTHTQTHTHTHTLTHSLTHSFTHSLIAHTPHTTHTHTHLCTCAVLRLVYLAEEKFADH